MNPRYRIHKSQLPKTWLAQINIANGQNSTQTQNSNSLVDAIKQMSSIFKELIKKQVHQALTNIRNKTLKIENKELTSTFCSLTSPRDQYVQFLASLILTLTKKMKLLQKVQIMIKWVSQVCKASISTSFNYYFQQKMTYKQAKVFCSQCILRNIIRLNMSHPLSAKDMASINQQMKNNILIYMGQRYPMTEQIISNNQLEKMINQIDNLDTIDNDMFWKFGVQFKVRMQRKNYNDLIMRVLSYVISIINKQVKHQGNLSNNFKIFQSEMVKIFQIIYTKQTKQTKLQTDFNFFQNEDFDEIFKTNKNKSYVAKKIQPQNQQQLKLEEQQKEKIRQYSQYLIGRKIPQNISGFTQLEINSNHLIIKSPTIRVNSYGKNLNRETTFQIGLSLQLLVENSKSCLIQQQGRF